MPVERRLAAAGANWARLRVWVDPLPDWADLKSALELGRRAAAADMQILLDLHYSDTWADSRNQAVPHAWQESDLDGLTRIVRSYTREVVAAFRGQGTPVSMVQIGNEISGGFLWPFARLQGDREGLPALAALLRAGVEGARRGAGGEVRVLLHTEHGADNAGARRFYDGVNDLDVPFDVIGLSFYPFWHGSLARLEANLRDLAVRYRQDILVVETAYPWRRATPDELEAFCRGDEQLPDAATYPATPVGQADYFEALRGCVLGVAAPERVLGFVVWEPAWFAGVGWGPGAPNPWANLTMFDSHGRALPSLRVFRSSDDRAV